MNIDSGVYRGVEIEIGLMDQCDGEIGVSLNFKNKKIRKYFPKFDEADLRRALHVPATNSPNEFHFDMNVDDRIIFYHFRFACLRAITKYGFLATLFRAIDHMWKVVNENSPDVHKKEEKTPEEPITDTADDQK